MARPVVATNNIQQHCISPRLAVLLLQRLHLLLVLFAIVKRRLRWSQGPVAVLKYCSAANLKRLKKVLDIAVPV
jgi:hypothetical protein